MIIKLAIIQFKLKLRFYTQLEELENLNISIAQPCQTAKESEMCVWGAAAVPEFAEHIMGTGLSPLQAPGRSFMQPCLGARPVLSQRQDHGIFGFAFSKNLIYK